MSTWRLDWPWPGGEPLGTGTLKSCPEDFRVTEIPGMEGPVLDLDPGGLPDPVNVPGQGEHLLIFLEKTGDNTPWVASELGKLAGCGDRGVGYCGLKDRHAVTRQWFSVQRPGQEADDVAFLLQVQQRCEGWRVLSVARQGRKLRIGEHQATGSVFVCGISPLSPKASQRDLKPYVSRDARTTSASNVSGMAVPTWTGPWPWPPMVAVNVGAEGAAA